jgi:hypothetical protein
MPSLPDRVFQSHGRWYLIDPRCELLTYAVEAAAIEEYAWRHAGGQLNEELLNEIAAFRAGARPLEELHRLRQYFRMLDAADNSSESEQRPRQPERPRWRAPVVATAVAAAALVIGAMNVGPAPPMRLTVAAVFPKPPGAIYEGASIPGVIPFAVTARLRSTVAYAVSVGRFASPKTADRMKHFVRRKGYVVEVVPRGSVSLVVTPPLSTRTQAEYVMNGLEVIGLPTQLVAWHTL